MELDLEELLATRLLVQGNSGSGKSHLLRRLIEGSAGLVQQVVIDPEGDFVTLADAYGHIPLDASTYRLDEVARFAARAREHRASVVLNLEGLEADEQMRSAATFLAALFDAPREHWYPVLVVVDEAQLFAPAAAGDVSEEARRATLAAMTNLMCRGRKRGLAGVIATQRLAKLAKNVAAEASNFLMGRTFLDIDMARAADLLGMERRQADVIRDLARGDFLALGPAISRRPLSVRIGPVATAGRTSSPKLVPLPSTAGGEMRDRMFAANDGPPSQQRPRAVATPIDEVMRSIAEPSALTRPLPDAPMLDEAAREQVRSEAVRAVAAERTQLPIAQLYQDYEVRCRMRGLRDRESLDGFRRRLAMALAGLDSGGDWDQLWALASVLDPDMWAPFLAIARAAQAGAACPDDLALAELYGTSSPRRAQRMLDTIAAVGLIVVRVDMAGRRSISLPHLGWTTDGAVPRTGPEQLRRRANGSRRR